MILGIVGVIGSPIIIFNNLTAVAAGVGVVLGAIAVFGTRKLLAGLGVVLCVAAIVITVVAQGRAVEQLDEQLGEITGGSDATGDVTLSGCEVVDDGYGFTRSEATITIRNSTDRTQSYFVTVSVNDQAGARVGEINAVSNSLTAGQSVTLSGLDATGIANDGAEAGSAACTVARVDRFPS